MQGKLTGKSKLAGGHHREGYIRLHVIISLGVRSKTMDMPQVHRGPPAVHRFPELDLVRALAVLGMVTYHAAYDLQFFYSWKISVLDGGWLLLARATATTFFLLVGITFRISWTRTRERLSLFVTLRKYLRRGLLVILCGMLVTAATYRIDANTFVRFGVLHFIGVSIILLPLFTRLKIWNACVGGFVLFLGIWIQGKTASFSLLLPFGITPGGFISVDYYPLVPWFGWVLLGDAIGFLLYVRHREWRTCMSEITFPKIFLWPGKNALILYLLHQPIILIVLWGLLGKPLF